MTTEYVSRVFLTINGQEITDFKSVTEKDVELHKQVNLMNTTGVVGVRARYGAEVEYVVPENAEEFDFEEVKDGTLTIEKMNGRRTSYTGVFTLKIGSTKYDGDNEATRTIEFLTTGRVKE